MTFNLIGTVAIVWAFSEMFFVASSIATAMGFMINWRSLIWIAMFSSALTGIIATRLLVTGIPTNLAQGPAFGYMLVFACGHLGLWFLCATMGMKPSDARLRMRTLGVLLILPVGVGLFLSTYLK